MQPEVPDKIEEAVDSPVQDSPPQRKITFNGIEKRLKVLTSILLKVFTVIILVIGGIFIIDELLDNGYSIHEVQMPAAFEANGYSGEVVANRISDALVEIMTTERFSEEAALYSTAFSRKDISVDVVGTGIPIRSLVDLIGDALGFDGKKMIKNDVVLDGDTAILTIKVADHKPLHYFIPFDGSYHKTVSTLADKAAESVLMYSSPYILARHYLYQNAEGNRKLSKFLFDQAATDKKLEPLAYFSLAGALVTERNPAAAEKVLREGLLKSPLDINLNAALGTMLQEQNKRIECLAQQKKVVSMFTRKTTTLRKTLAYNNLALAYRINNEIDSALYFFDKALSLDQEAGLVYLNLARTHLLNRNDTAQFFNNLEVALKKGMRERFVNGADLKGMMSHPKVLELLKE